MRKILSIVMVLALAMAMAAPAMAAKDSFVPSIGYKDGPEIVGGDLVDCLENTSISEAEKGETSISQEDRELLLDIYQQLVDGTMKLPIENDRYVIRDLIDVSFTPDCDEAHDHDGWLKEEENSISLTFDLGVGPDEKVIIMVYVDGQWQEVECVNNGDGTVTGIFKVICPVIFCVENTTPPAQTGDASGRMLGLWAALMAASAAAMAVLVVRRRAFMG